MASSGQPDDPTGSFISQFVLEGSKEGPLAGQRVAVKDLYHIASHKTGLGNPTWRETHPVATDTSAAVAALLAAGAVVVGKSHLDEMAFSPTGINSHYGTPKNVAAPGRMPGGSSSGSATAVAAGQADIGLGSDTAGSVRFPASYCGLFGIRPTHGRVSMQHSVVLADNYDTCGWLTCDAALFQRVGGVLLEPTSAVSTPLGRWLVATDAFALASPATSTALRQLLARPAVAQLLGEAAEVEVAGQAVREAGLQQLPDWWTDALAVKLSYDLWRSLRGWITEVQPAFGPGKADRYRLCASISDEQAAEAAAKCDRLKAHVLSLLGDDGLLVLPSAPGPAPLLDAPPAEMAEWLPRLFGLNCIAVIGGLPQVSLPLASVDGLPVGLSLIGPPGSDEQLLELAVRLADAAAVPVVQEDKVLAAV